MVAGRENGAGRGVRISGVGRGLRGSTDVSMVEATDFAKRHDPAGLRPFDGPPVGRVLVEREMRACAVIVREIRGQAATQVRLAEHDDMVEALSPHRANEPFRKRILPGTVGRREDFLDAHAACSVPEGLAVDGVAIAEEIGRRGLVRKRLHDLLGGPDRGGMLGDVEAEDPSPMVGKHDQDEEHPQARGGDREEIDGDQVLEVVGEERPPGLSCLGLRPAKAHENRAGLN